jgi:hypothetical protein
MFFSDPSGSLSVHSSLSWELVHIGLCIHVAILWFDVIRGFYLLWCFVRVFVSRERTPLINCPRSTKVSYVPAAYFVRY